MATTSTIAALAPQVQDRLQDPNGVFWSQQYEVFAALEEAISELLLIVGRPTTVFNQPLTIQPNVCFQSMPSGLLAITDIFLNGKKLWKTSLRALDVSLASWGPAWESDRAAAPARWAPAGLGLFIVHPAPLQPVLVTVTGVAYPFTDAWPPNGTESSPFHIEIDQALQMYSASYCRLKECGNDAETGIELYRQFLEIGQRLSVIEDRRDQLIWTKSLGVSTAPSSVSAR